MRTLSLVIAIVLFVQMVTPSNTILVQNAQGTSQDFGNTEIFPTANVGNRTIAISLKMYSNSSDSSNSTHYLQFRTFDANTNQTINHVSLLVNITKGNQLLLEDLFYTNTGILTLEINSTNTPGYWTVEGNHEPILNGWEAYKDDEPLVVNAPIFTDDSIYRLYVEIFSIDTKQSVFDHNNSPKFESFLSLKDQNELIVVMKSLKQVENTSHVVVEISPLKQFKLGIKISDIKCTKNFQRIVKAEDGSPACVQPDTVNILIERGWAKS